MPTKFGVSKQFDSFSGFFYTDANLGYVNGTGTVRAGFFGDSTANDYYIVADPNWQNVGVKIMPSLSQNNGFCAIANCEFPNCTGNAAYSQPPTAFPPAGSTAPDPPLYQCPTTQGGTVNYNITFCPSGLLTTQTFTLHPNGNANKCLDVQGDIVANGTPVQIYDCNGSRAQNWMLNRGLTAVRLGGTNFCLDAGDTPGNGTGMKIWQCFDNLPAQQWYYTSDNRIALYSKGLCLDLTNGDLTNGKQSQTWQCTDGDTNQVWTE